MKRILVALDGSERQGHVLDAALELARPLGAKLVLLRAVSIPVELPRAALSASPDSLAGLLEKQARQDLALVSERAAGLVERTRVELGTPWHTIVDVARAEGVDLIVIGSHGYGGLDRLLGTTAAKVVNHADRRVLVVR
jgi:nucleotide-binding universal stress UspA family protein